MERTNRGFALVARDSPSQPNTKQSNRHVGEENTAPYEHVYQQPAVSRPRAHRRAATTWPNAEGYGAFPRVEIGMVNQRQRTRHQQGRADSLQYAGEGENGQVGGESAQGRRRGEQD